MFWKKKPLKLVAFYKSNRYDPTHDSGWSVNALYLNPATSRYTGKGIAYLMTEKDADELVILLHETTDWAKAE